MPRNDIKSGDECEVGLLCIDWDRRKWKVRGIGGHANDLMTLSQVLRELKRPIRPNIEVMAIVAWKENADGYPQLCFYDLATYQAEVYGPPQ